MSSDLTHRTHRFNRLLLLALTFGAVLVLILSTMMDVSAQQPQQQPRRGMHSEPTGTQATTGSDEPLLREYKGVKIGMTAEEARQKLGQPADKSDAQDLYSYSEKEIVQLFYDQTHKVNAVSISYLGEGAPLPEKVVGEAVEPKTDGSCYKMVKYAKAGYWVSYSRTAGASPMVTIVMQRSGN